MQALDLTKQYFKQSPTPENRELLKAVYLERARHLRAQGQIHDAATVLEVAAGQAPNDAGWLERVATELLACGDVARASRLMGGLPEDRRAALARPLADASLLDDRNTAGLSPQQLAERDAIRAAFAHHEAGRDDDARATLGPIGLKSPYLEWKVLLRGLIAYQTGDDAGAIENWQRLDPGRLPARLAAPFRAQIDAAFRDAQPPATRDLLGQQLTRLQGTSPAEALRRALAHLSPDGYAEAARLLAPVVSLLRQTVPQIAARVEQAFYWAMLPAGPSAVHSYRQTFGTPPDDPRFDRIQAMGNEAGGDLSEANRHWQQVERGIARGEGNWIGEDARLARALIWCRMGENVARMPTPNEISRLPRWLRPPPEVLHFEPGALECFRRALELAPDLLAAAAGRVEYLGRVGDVPRAIDACHDLLRHHPDDLDTLLELADLHQEQAQLAGAVDALQRATRLKPLDDHLRIRLANAQLARAYGLLRSSGLEAARPDFEAALTVPSSPVAIRMHVAYASALRVARQQDEAERQLQAARARGGSPVLLNYLQLVEGHLVGQKPADRKPLLTAFNQGLAAGPSAQDRVRLATYASGYVERKVEYYGQATHNKKIAEAALGVRRQELSEEDLLTLARSLPGLKAPVRPLRQLFSHAQAKYPLRPEFLILDAQQRIGDDVPDPGQAGSIHYLLTRADQLLKKAPATPEYDSMREYVASKLAMLRVINPYFDLSDLLLDRFNAFDEDYEDYEDYDD